VFDCSDAVEGGEVVSSLTSLRVIELDLESEVVVIQCTMGAIGLLQFTRVLGLLLSAVLLWLVPSIAAGSFTFPVITDEATQVLRICARLLFM